MRASLALVLFACGDNAAPAVDAGIDARDESELVPAELSSASALATAADWSRLPSFAERAYRMQSSSDRGALDDPPIVLLDNGNADMNQFLCKSANADIRYPVLFEPHLDLDVCPEDYVEGFVFARFEGPGTLARLWLTALSLDEERAEEVLLRFYVDDEPRPVVRARLVDVATGAASPMFAPPFGAGSARSVSWHYPLVFSNKLVMTVDHLRHLDLFYHQTSIARGTTPQEHVADDEELSAERDAVATLWSALAAGPAADATVVASATPNLAAGQELELIDHSGSGTLTRVRLTTETPAALGDLTLRFFFDGAGEPAIDVSAAALFGSFESPTTQPSLALAIRTEGSATTLELRLPMPYRTQVRIVAHNVGESDHPFALELAGAGELPAEPFGHLRAHENQLLAPATGRYPVFSTTGKGRLVGSCMALEGYALEELGAFGSGLNFLEGDERIAIDGQDVVVGTGTEDYFDSAFYFGDGDFGTTFAQAWGIEDDEESTPRRGQVSACRWHLFHDAIDFAESIDFDLEIGAGVPDTLERYRSIVYYYQ